MKRSSFWCILAVLLSALCLLSGCAGSTAAADRAPAAGYKESYAYSDEEFGYMSDNALADVTTDAVDDVIVMESTGTSSSGLMQSFETPDSQTLSEKIIYTGSAEIETVEFDASVEKVYELVKSYGGFLESSSISGRDYRTTYYDNVAYRQAEFVIRVPKANFASLQDNLSVLGYVVENTTWTENITARYMDTESRLAAFRTEEESLLRLLDEAESVEDMITIESRLSEVRYEIESLTSTLRYYQTQVDYSTLTLYLREVAKIVEHDEIPTTYWDEVVQTFKDSVRSVVDGIGWLGKAIVAAIPVLLLPALLIMILVPVLRRRAARRREAAMQAWQQAQRNQQPPMPPQNP